MNGGGGAGCENKGAINCAPTTRSSVGARFIAPDLPPKSIASDTSALNTNIHHRRSIRLRSYDYSQAGAYFITLCTQKRECLFGTVEDDAVRLNDIGQMVQEVWIALPEHYSGVELDYFVVMPNHIHGIVALNNVGARITAEGSLRSSGEPAGVPLAGAALNNDAMPNQGAMNRAPMVGEIIRVFKARCTRGINQLSGLKGVSIWQRNYYEHVIRNESSLHEIREYIVNNPAQWAMDRENPDVVGAQFIAPNDDVAENPGKRKQGAMNLAPTGGEA